MSFMDKLGSAAATAKWKADQQMRIMRAQNSIRDVENQVKTQKAALAETALQLYAQGALTEAPLVEACAAITQLTLQIGQLTETLRQIQAEQPPGENQPAPVPAPAAPAPTYASPAPAAAPVPTPAPAAAVPAQPARLVCPVCGMELAGRFCPEHGREGVPAA